MKKVIALIVSVLLLATLLAACTPVGSETPPTLISPVVGRSSAPIILKSVVVWLIFVL